MSNTEDASADAAAAETFLSALVEWGGALRVYGRALASYATEVNDVAQRMLGARSAASWDLALEAARAAQEMGAPGVARGSRELPGPPTHIDVEQKTTKLFDEHADRLEAMEVRLLGAENLILDPAVRDSAAAGVGRTFSDNLSRLLDSVHRARRGCSAAHIATLEAAKVYGRSLAQTRPDEVLAVASRWWAPGVGDDSNRVHGGVASAVYTWALARVRALGGPDAAAAGKMLEAAKNGSLGIPGDTPEDILADSRRGRSYHPMQTLAAMPRLVVPQGGHRAPRAAKIGGAIAWTPLALESGEVLPALPWAPFLEQTGFIDLRTELAKGGNATADPLQPVVDARLPQAKKDVQYDLAALIDPARAGPGDTVRSGLNYKLVERLRSIRETPRDGGETLMAAVPLPERVQDSFLLTFGGSQVLRATPPGWDYGRLEGDWAPAAGVPPRLSAYSGAVGVLVAARRTDAAPLVDKFTAESSSEKAAASSGPHTRVSLDILLARIMQKFSAAYDAAPGDGPATPAEFLGIAAPSEYATGLYLEAAVFDAGLAHLNRLFDRFWAPGTSGSRITAEGARRELAATVAVQAAAAGFELWRRVVGVYLRRAPDGAPFGYEPGQRKAALTRVHRETIAAALAAPPLDYVQMTFKLFHLLGGAALFIA